MTQAAQFIYVLESVRLHRAGPFLSLGIFTKIQLDFGGALFDIRPARCDVYKNFQTEGARLAKELGLEKTAEAFSLSKRKLQKEVFRAIRNDLYQLMSRRFNPA